MGKPHVLPECAICYHRLNKVETDNNLCATRCGHVFHDKCIKKVIRPMGSKTCPVCEAKLDPKQLISMYYQPQPFSETDVVDKRVLVALETSMKQRRNKMHRALVKDKKQQAKYEIDLQENLLPCVHAVEEEIQEIKENLCRAHEKETELSKTESELSWAKRATTVQVAAARYVDSINYEQLLNDLGVRVPLDMANVARNRQEFWKSMNETQEECRKAHKKHKQLLAQISVLNEELKSAENNTAALLKQLLSLTARTAKQSCAGLSSERNSASNDTLKTIRTMADRPRSMDRTSQHSLNAKRRVTTTLPGDTLRMKHRKLK